MDHRDDLYPHWRQVRDVLVSKGDLSAFTTGDIATAVVEALRAQLTNDTVELTKRLHEGAAHAGWFDTLRAFARAIRTLHGDHVCYIVELPEPQNRDGWALTHALLMQLPGQYEFLQVSWRLTNPQASVLAGDGVVFSRGAGARVWDGHTRQQKYERLAEYARTSRRKDQT